MSVGSTLKKMINAPAVLAIRFYQKCISPLFPPVCRFHPSCSNYALDCFKHYGLFKALWMTCWRILRCNPMSKGGYDPVPIPGQPVDPGPPID